jgi:arylsulfatase A-like enzyme
MDDWLGRVLDALDASKVLDETHVIVTSDHGENLGEDGLLGHAFSLDDRLIRVPFISSTPLAGSTDVLSLRDLPRLLATAVGLDDHPWEGSGEPSVAVAQLDPLAPADDPRVAEYVERSALDERGALRLTTGAVVATDGRRKLLRRGGTDVLFDLVEDPMELRGEPLDRVGAREVGDLVAAVDAAEEPHPVGSLPVARIEEQMRLLGYL